MADLALPAAEHTYALFKACGGSQQRMLDEHARLKKNKELPPGLPKTPRTLMKYVDQYDMPGRYAKELQEHYSEAMQVQTDRHVKVMSQVAENFHELLQTYVDFTKKTLEELKQREDGHLVLLKKNSVLNPEAIEKAFKMYLRAMNLPEKIQHNTHEILDHKVLVLEPDEIEQIQEANNSKQVTKPRDVDSAAEGVIIDV